jgi:peptide chain release factor 2
VKICSNAGKPCRNVSSPSGGFFDTSDAHEELGAIDEKLSDADVWSDPDEAARLNQRRSVLSREIARGESLKTKVEDVETFAELENEGEDVTGDLEAAIGELEREVDEVEVSAMMTGHDDHRNAFVAIHPGAGGVDAQDWAEMLTRMYVRWAEREGFKVELIERQAGDEAGIKSATLRIEGTDAFGWLRSERGVHRLVRISPFDAQRRRHTAFASVDVTPEIDEDIEITVEEKDLRVDTYRSSGAGGQHVNVTDSAVRITHMPTGLVVACQDERSQHRNREKAMKVLKSRLYEREVRDREAKRLAAAGEKKDIDFGSQIRSYVLAPYRLVKDLRTQEERGDVDRVLDGDLTPFMKAWLLSGADA